MVAEADARARTRTDSAGAEIVRLDARIRELRALSYVLYRRRQVFQDFMQEGGGAAPVGDARESTQPESEPAASELGDTLQG